MNTLRIFNDKARYIAAAFVLLLTLVIPILASAAQVTTRSIELSSATVGATNVKYTVKFTVPSTSAAAAAFVVDFCSDSPIIGQACTAPAGMNAASAASASSGVTAVSGSANKVVVTKPIVASDNVDVELTGITNSTAADTVYARIVTYDTQGHAAAYVSNNLGTGNIDDGAVAFALTNNISVSGDVLESLTFCVANQTITKDCGDANDVGHEPTLKLGEDVGGGILALSPGVLSTGKLYTQISTNALSGAVVRLKSSTLNCGGLLREGSTDCLAPALQTGITTPTDAKFGVLTAAATNSAGATEATGDLAPVQSSGYNNSTYALNFAAGNASGVTSDYGDPFLDTAGAPANNKNMELTFGATINNNTPAGRYSAALSLIATGKF